uniref:Uncharacterized protein n=1 Tax=Lepeophtheirus salmonis TaxID=72036 RepID=A0A0K2V824_LEPSM
MQLKSLVLLTFTSLVLLSSIPECEGLPIDQFFCLLSRINECRIPSDAGKVYTVTVNFFIFTRSFNCRCPPNILPVG